MAGKATDRAAPVRRRAGSPEVATRATPPASAAQTSRCPTTARRREIRAFGPVAEPPWDVPLGRQPPVYPTCRDSDAG